MLASSKCSLFFSFPTKPPYAFPSFPIRAPCNNKNWTEHPLALTPMQFFEHSDKLSFHEGTEILGKLKKSTAQASPKVKGAVPIYICFCSSQFLDSTPSHKKKGGIGCSGVPRNFVPGRGVQKIQLRSEDREKGDLGGGSPLVRGSGGSCNLV